MTEPDSGDRPTITCRTITSLWRFPRAIYRFGPIPAPVPIPWVSVLYALAFLIPIWVVLSWVRVPYANIGLTLRGVVPFFLAAACVRAASNGQRPSEIAWSWVRQVWVLARKGSRVRTPTRLRSRPVTRLAPVPTRLRSRPWSPR